MADVLSQNEVEALLSALDQGTLEQPATPVKESDAPETLGADVTLYDFKRPERVGKEHMRALQTMHEGFSRNFSAQLSGFLRTIVDVKLVSVDQLTYSEFIFSLENPTCFVLMTCKPLDGRIVLEFNPSIVFPIIDRLLGGGRGEVLIPRRPLTDIEAKLVYRLCYIAIGGLKQIWSSVMDIDYQVESLESNPQLVYIVPPNEVVVLVSFELSIGELRGMVNLCVPFNVIEPVIDKLSTNSWLSYAKKEANSQSQVVAGLRNAPVEMTVYLGETRITAQDLIQLQVGDLIPLEKSTKSGLLVTIADQPKFRGTMGAIRGRKVIKLTDKVDLAARMNG